MQLSRKQKTFSDIFFSFFFFFSFLKSSLNIENFQKKDDPHSWCISEITDPEKPAFLKSSLNFEHFQKKDDSHG